MGDWAEEAYKRFQDGAGDQRRREELELQRAVQINAKMGPLWKEFVETVRNNVDNFNRRAQRGFFQLGAATEGEFYINAPKLSVVVTLSFDARSISYAYMRQTPTETVSEGGGRFEFILDDGEVWMVDDGRNRVTAKDAAATVLNKLVA
jgi:hypothetical protein